MSAVAPLAPKSKKSELPQAVAKPDDASYNKRIEAETAAIDAARKKLDAINEKLSANSGGREEFTQQREGHRRRIDDLNAKLETLETERKTLTGRVDDYMRSGAQARENAQKLKKELGFNTEQEIDQKIAEIETLIMTSTLKFSEEKLLVREISQLKARRPLVASMAKQTDAPPDTKSLTSMRARLDELRDEINSLRDLRRTEQEKFRDLNQARQSAMAPLQDLYDQRAKIQDELSEHRQLKSELMDDLRAKLREYQAYVAKVRAAKQDAYREEQKKKVAERERTALEEELALCDEPALDPTHELILQAIEYIKRLMKPVVEEEILVDTAAIEVMKQAAENGQVAVLPKSSRPEENSVKPKKRKQKKSKQTATSPITHTFDTLADFRTLDINPPNSLSDCEAVLVALRAKEVVFQERRKLQLAGTAQKREILVAKLKVLKDAELQATGATPTTDESAKTTSGADEE